MEIRAILTGIFLVLGCFFILVASIGIIRFPDIYSRIHPAGKTDTLGQALILIGLLIYEGFTFVGIKLIIIILFVFVANPTSTHALANAAYAVGVKPWKKGDPAD
jgi:multicomponent Na+:H+ antiporter subunit G